MASGAQFKPVKLRNQVPAFQISQIHTNQASAPLSGLYLIQFHQSPDAATRAQLDSAGVDLVHYIPTDTYLARLHGVRPETIRGFPTIQSIGKYGPEHKIHKSLQAAKTAKT